MPLYKSKSKKAFSKNVEEESDSGKPQDQSLAIAYNIQKKAKKKYASGGEVQEPIPGKPYEYMSKEEQDSAMDAGAPLSDFYNPKKQSGEEAYKKENYADGGPVSKPAPSPSPSPEKEEWQKKFSEGLNGKKKYAQGGEVEEHYDSIADAIMRKKRMSDGGEVDLNANSEEAGQSPYDNYNSEAGDAEQYDLDQLSSQPIDSNEHGDEIESDKHDMVASIRKKLKKS